MIPVFLLPALAAVAWHASPELSGGGPSAAGASAADGQAKEGEPGDRGQPGERDAGRRALEWLERLAALPAGPACERVPDPATRERCAARRRDLGRELGDGLFFAAAGRDREGRFRPDDDFYWLTGVDVPGAALALEVREGMLFAERLYLPPYDRRAEVWRGPRLAPGRRAAERTGIADTRPATRLALDLEELLARVDRVAGRGEPLDGLLEGRELKLVRTARLLRPLQAVKDPSELRVLQVLIDVTQVAIVEAMREAKPGSWEFVVEAAVDGGMRRRGVTGAAFPSICASGPNSCVLDYQRNDRRLAAGDVMILDVGAELYQYACDLTRTFPVDGAFSERQREVYLVVWEAAQRAASELQPGTRLREIHRSAERYLSERGYGRESLPHMIGHGIGLRVHDFPWAEDPLEVGMVVTIEPGVYLPEEDLGVRMEDAYVITEDGARLLSGALPSHPDDVEALLAAVRRETPEARGR